MSAGDGNPGAGPPSAPLAGLRVVEIGHSVAAPYAGLVLAELGAEVVKIEKPGAGDDCRGWGPPFHEGASATFHALNRLKRSVVMDLKDSGERARLRALIVETADVVVQNLRPGQADEIGLGAKVLTEAAPRLIYANIHAFGAQGPLAGKPGYDPLMQAFGGLMGVTGEEGRPPIRVGTSLIDMGTGMWVVIGVLAALARRGSTGRGGVVDASLYETALGWMLYHVTSFSLSREEPRRQGSGAAMIAPYQAFRTADGDVVIGGGNDNLFRKLAAAIGLPGLADDPRYRSNAERVANRDVLAAAIAAVIAQRSSAKWVAILEEAGVPCAPVQTVGQVLAHPQTAALDVMRRSPGEAMTYVGLPLSFDGERPSRSEPAPALGADTDAVLGARSLTDVETAR